MKIYLWSAVALALFGTVPAWAQRPDGLRVVGHFDPPLVAVPEGSPSDRHSLIAEEPLNDDSDPPPAKPSAPPAYADDAAAVGSPSPVVFGGQHQSCNEGQGQCQCDSGNSGYCCQSDCCHEPGLLDCCQVCPPSGWNAEIGFYFLKPHWQSNQAFSVVSGFGGLNSSQSNVDFSYNYNVSPFVALGYTRDDGLGFKIRFWDFQDNASVGIANGANQFATAAMPLNMGQFANVNPNTTATANSNLRIKVWDFEITQQLACNCWVWNFGGGIRYLHTSQAFNSTINGAVNTPDDVTSSHRFKGVGPTLSLGGQRSLGCSGISLYGNGRASVLVGDNTQAAQLSAANGTLGPSSLQSSWGTLTVTELEIGVAYQRTFGCFTMVANTGLVGQYWSGMGNAANVDAFGTFADETQNNAIGMAMYGMRTSLSFYY